MLFLNKRPDLSSVEFDLYRYISSNPDLVIKQTIRELADASHTSTATIMRFCKKFECKGFSEFKIKLKIYLEDKVNLPCTESDETILIDFLQRTGTPFYQEKIDKAAKLISEKELILFLGMGSSNIIASYGSLYFSSLFKMSVRIEDPTNHPIYFLSPELSKKMCIIALSVSGETIELINYLSHMNISNSTIISITNSSNSTIANLSDLNIPYYIGMENLKGADITSQVPALYTIETIAKKVRILQNMCNEY